MVAIHSKPLRFSEWGKDVASEYAKRSAGGEMKMLYENYNPSKAETEEAEDGWASLNRLNKCLEDLDKKGFERSYAQRVLHQKYAMACSEQMFGESINTCLPELLEEFDTDEIKAFIAAIMPRRFGKTMGTAIWAAAYAITQYRVNIVMYSTGRRVSSAFLELVAKIIMIYDGNDDRIIKCNQEEIVLLGHNGCRNSIRSYPANVNIDTYFHVRGERKKERKEGVAQVRKKKKKKRG